MCHSKCELQVKRNWSKLVKSKVVYVVCVTLKPNIGSVSSYIADSKLLKTATDAPEGVRYN